MWLWCYIKKYMYLMGQQLILIKQGNEQGILSEELCLIFYSTYIGILSNM